MAYGDYDGPDKMDKGRENGSCSRTRCQAPNAVWYNHGSLSWYCEDCRNDIENDSFNSRHWEQNVRPVVKHPMFETRSMIEKRKR